MKTHVLRHGRPMCGFTRAVPGFWPEGHGWVHQPDASGKADCQGCLDALAGLNPRTAEVRTVGDLIARLKLEDPTMPVVVKAPLTMAPWAEALAVDVERHGETGHSWGATVVIGGVPVAPEDW